MNKKYRYKKLRRIRKKKSVFRSRFFWFGFLFAVALATGCYFFIFSPTFQIKEIKISGNIKVPIEDLKNTIFEQIEKRVIFFDSKSIFLADLRKTNEIILEKLPQVAKVTLEKKFPNVLAAQIEERKPVAVFIQNEQSFFIDREGVIFEEVAEPETKMLKIKLNSPVSPELGNEVVDREKIEKILEINSKIALPLEEILVVSERRFNARTLEGLEIYFNPKRDLTWQLEELSILLKERIPPEKRRNIEYIDLRFDKIYIYPENY